MAFDSPTRNKLAKMISVARQLLVKEFTDQLQQIYGIHPDGVILAVEKLNHLDDQQTAKARLLRERIEHLVSAMAEEKAPVMSAIERTIREQSFTLLNRFAALRMCEERGFVEECIRGGMQSRGFKVYETVAGAGLGGIYERYRTFLFCLFDEIAVDLGILFDRFSPEGLLFPREPALLELLKTINTEELKKLWAEDETIGWIYQYFNSKEEREAMRKASAAPRNSRELAVRNQFFTPRYVVEFLTDNTLGRIWYEMRRGKTSLNDKCLYLVRRPVEIFLEDNFRNTFQDVSEGVFSAVKGDFSGLPQEPSWNDIQALALFINGYETAPQLGLGDCAELYRSHWEEYQKTGEWTGNIPELWCCLFYKQRLEHDSWFDPAGPEFEPVKTLYLSLRKQLMTDLSGLNQEELLRSPAFIPNRPIKDPRDIKILDPACGSGHFLLYAFDLLETIYLEAWNDPQSPESEISGHTLREDYENLEDLRRATPDLVLRWNLHGIDIDPRAVQIAALALWLRTQKSWQQQGFKATERPRITRSNIVTAEAMPGEEDMRRDFIESLNPRVLGQLVEVVFEKMKLAGEAGSLLKIEEDIRAEVTKAKDKWRQVLKPEQQLLFPDFAPLKHKQLELPYDVKGITDEKFWDQAEELIHAALREYAEKAVNGGAVRRRLFAEDTAQGFAFIDICRKRYDVVLMNPPFGEFAKNYKVQTRITYPNSYNDIFAAVTERWYWRLNEYGALGAITSRVGFFLTSFKKWRSEFLLKHRGLSIVADFGEAVMDDALVESAAYTLNRSLSSRETTIVRLLGQKETGTKLSSVIADLANGKKPDSAFFIDLESCMLLPGSPIVYWVEPGVLRSLVSHPQLEPTIAQVRQGLVTGDNPRFTRGLWEIPNSSLNTCGHFENGSAAIWAPLVMKGPSQPWYSPITVAVKWANEGSEIKNFMDNNGKLKSRPQNIQFYFQPGFSWTRRAVRFIPYAVPPGCIPTASRYMAFPANGSEFSVLGVTASNAVSAFLRFYGERFCHPNFLVENIKSIPWPNQLTEGLADMQSFVSKQFSRRRRTYQNHEPFHDFTAPSLLFPNLDVDALIYDLSSLIGKNLERIVSSAYGYDDETYQNLTRDLREAVAFNIKGSAIEISDNGSDDNDDDEKEFLLVDDSEVRYEALISYSIGCALGRWDCRMGLNHRLIPALPGPFDPLPICPPGMLVGPEGLPAKSGGIVSEEWLRARLNAITLPPEESVNYPTIPDSEYPLRISWGGILVDDPGFHASLPHSEDIVQRVQEVLELLWGDKAEAIEHEACEILGVKSLREYFRKPSGFFHDHLKRYSKSRRQAPIYWPLSTASGSYTLWLYYHRLTDQTLYTCVNDYVNPKLAEVSKDIERLRNEIAEGGTAKKRQVLEELMDLEQELKDFRDELLRVAQLPYKPNLNDGVIITAAPLWKLFRHNQWRKDLLECWKKLEAGDYDWAHLAYTIWPNRVREKCHKDRSVAIAHELEELYQGELPKVKKLKNKRKA